MGSGGLAAVPQPLYVDYQEAALAGSVAIRGAGVQRAGGAASQLPNYINGCIRQCNGHCGRKLLYAASDLRQVLTHRCPVCMCDTQWTRIDV